MIDSSRGYAAVQTASPPRAQHELSPSHKPRTSYYEARPNHPQDDEAHHHVLGTDQEKANGVGEIAYHQPYE
jgi:hypothetical protein